jgi:hypothetical protein
MELKIFGRVVTTAPVSIKVPVEVGAMQVAVDSGAVPALQNRRSQQAVGGGGGGGRGAVSGRPITGTFDSTMSV